MKKWTLTRIIATIGCILAAISLAVFLALATDRTEDPTDNSAQHFENARLITPKTFGSYGELMFAYVGNGNYLYNLDDESVPLVYQPVKELLYASDDSVLYTASCELDASHLGRESVIQELQIGETIVTGNSDLCDKIAEKTNTSVTIFQPTEDSIIRVATTVRNFDDTRAVGTVIGKDSKVYQNVIQKKEYFGRAFVVNKWFVAVYKPILDETGYLLGVLYLGLPEDETEEEEQQN